MQVMQYLFIHSSSIHGIFGINRTQNLNYFHTYKTFCIHNWQLTRRHQAKVQPTSCTHVLLTVQRACKHAQNLLPLSENVYSYTAW